MVSDLNAISAEIGGETGGRQGYGPAHFASDLVSLAKNVIIHKEQVV